MKIGRRKAVIIVNLLGVVGCVITVTELDYTKILIGRFLLGLSVGLISSICPKMLEETIPNHLWDNFGPMFSSIQCVGTLIACTLAVIYPDDSEK